MYQRTPHRLYTTENFPSYFVSNLGYTGLFVKLITVGQCLDLFVVQL